MPALSTCFDALKTRGEGALVTFVTAGDPPLDQFHQALDTLCDGGADILEIGVPFSDPIADGPTIQASSQRALNRGVTPSAVLEALKSWKREVKPPVVLMTYLNPVLRLGYREFADQAKASGVDAVLLTDMTVDEAAEWREIARETGLDTVFLIAPTSSAGRIQMAMEAATGFAYAVSRTGVTGAETKAESQATELVNAARSYGSVPICVGFGISSGADVLQFRELADGAIVGSAIVTHLEKIQKGEANFEDLRAFVRELKEATRTK